tara:strand:- start:242 stop:913 length:672 start_codon:yes stop_codon:yes gene_type:complete
VETNNFQANNIFIKWLFGFVLITCIFYLLFYYGFISELFENDISFISPVILFIFIVTTIFIGYQVNLLQVSINALKASDGKFITKNISLDKQQNYYIVCICELLEHTNVSNLSNIHELLELRLSKYHRIISFIVDLLIRLGLVGTVIGFILMLQSVTLIDNFDISLMQDLMKNMSTGMMVALYTTLTGLVTAIVLMFQNKYLELLLIDLYSLASEKLRVRDEI